MPDEISSVVPPVGQKVLRKGWYRKVSERKIHVAMEPQ